MNHASNFHPDDLAAMERACPTPMMKEIALRDARLSPSERPGESPGQQPTAGRPSAGDGKGWVREIPLGPSMHQRYVDAQLDAQDAKDRRELIEQKAREQALLKAAETKR